MPPPTADMDKPDAQSERERRHEALMATERSIPPVYRWARFSAPELAERAMTMPLVLLDDIGCERDLAMNPIPDIIFERHAANRSTWVTTGLTSQQLIKRYGTGVVGRVFDRAKVLQLGDRNFAADYRQGR